MKKSDLDRSMAKRSPLGDRHTVAPVDLYASPDARGDVAVDGTTVSSLPDEGVTALPDIQEYAQQYRREEDTKRVVSVKMYPGRHAQVKREAQEIGLYEWQVIDVALEMYFRTKRPNG